MVNLNSVLISALICLLWPKEFLHFGWDYDKSEVKENVFHCLWWQEANLFAKMSLLNIGVTLAPPSFLYQHQTKPGPIQLALKPIFLSPMHTSRCPVLSFCGLSPPPTKVPLQLCDRTPPQPPSPPQATSLGLLYLALCTLDNHPGSFLRVPFLPTKLSLIIALTDKHYTLLP